MVINTCRTVLIDFSVTPNIVEQNDLHAHQYKDLQRPTTMTLTIVYDILKYTRQPTAPTEHKMTSWL